MEYHLNTGARQSNTTIVIKYMGKNIAYTNRMIYHSREIHINSKYLIIESESIRTVICSNRIRMEFENVGIEYELHTNQSSDLELECESNTNRIPITSKKIGWFDHLCYILTPWP